MTCIVSIVANETLGISQRRKGTRNRDVCSADIASVDAEKMKSIQTMSGTQYLAKFLSAIRGAQLRLAPLVHKSGTNPFGPVRLSIAKDNRFSTVAHE